MSKFYAMIYYPSFYIDLGFYLYPKTNLIIGDTIDTYFLTEQACPPIFEGDRHNYVTMYDLSRTCHQDFLKTQFCSDDDYGLIVVRRNHTGEHSLRLTILFKLYDIKKESIVDEYDAYRALSLYFSGEKICYNNRKPGFDTFNPPF